MLWSSSLPVAEAGIEILAPPEPCSTEADRVHLVGRADGKSVEVRLDGEAVQTIPVKDGFFHALLWLPYGLHTFRVVPTGLDAHATDVAALSDEIDVLCGPRISREFERMFPTYSFHADAPSSVCLECHVPPTAGAEVDGGEGDWCLQCHGVIRDRFRMHLESGSGECTTCHLVDPDLSLEAAGVYSDMNPCYLCHKDKIGEFAKDYIHGPVAGGTCTICHDPHGSRYEGSLQSPVPILCMYCHSDLDEPTEDSIVHKPFAEGKCVACHDPHATNNRWVLVQSSQELCIGCHSEEQAMADHVHPYNVKPKIQNRYDLQLTESGQLECLSCHAPHYGNAEHLLRTDPQDTCIGCHPEQK